MRGQLFSLAAIPLLALSAAAVPDRQEEPISVNCQRVQLAMESFMTYVQEQSTAPNWIDGPEAEYLQAKGEELGSLPVKFPDCAKVVPTWWERHR